MTNEQLATLAQTGDREAIASLWDQVRRLLFKLINAHVREQGIAPGVEVEDLQQDAFLAMLAAVDAYKPDAEYKFTTYLQWHLRNAIAKAEGRSTTKRDAILSAVSLNTPLSDDETGELADLIEDESAHLAFDDIYIEQLQQLVESALQALPDDEAQALRLRFFEELTEEQVADRTGTTRYNAQKNIKTGLRKLSANRPLRAAWYAETHNLYSGNSLAVFRNSGMSAQERIVMRIY